ncbi:MAG: hypothetical protein ACKOXF_07460 [Chitinophagaceae bacterium]
MNSKYKIFTYKSTMWADASGYYVYLPATFIYQWDVKKLPSGIDTLTGRGFSTDTSKNAIFTKYTSGISYLQLPFFAAAHLYASITGEEANGFSQVYVNSLLFSGVFYLLLALFCLYYFLLDYFGKLPSLFTCLALLAATNLYYYGIEHPGLSHVYSFFLICGSLLLIQKNSRNMLIIVVPAAVLLVLIRPTNIVAVVTLLFIHFDLNAYSIRQFIKIRQLYIGLLAGLLFLIPQLFYWHSLTGQWLMYSYQNEGFIYWNRPFIAEVLLAACNGFLTYAPVFLLAFAGLIWKPLTRINSIIILISFALITYLNASWWCWPFGCAYGGRAFIEYYPFLAIGLAAFINQFVDKGKKSTYTIAIILLALSFLNLKLLYNYDDCFYGGTWDYHVIRDLLF